MEDPVALAESATKQELSSLAASAVSSLPLEKLPEFRARISEQLAKVADAQKKLTSNDQARAERKSMRQVPVLLKVGGQGYRLWKASHEVLATEISSRTPPEMASPVVRGESKRFQG